MEWTQLARTKNISSVRLDDVPADRCGAVAVHLEEGSKSTAVWGVRVFALLERGKVLAAEFQTDPPPASNAARATRVVAIVRVPGVRSWSADFWLISGAPVGKPMASLTADTCCGGAALEFPNERWSYLAGGVGAVVVPAGKRIKKVGCVSTAGGSVQIGGNPALTVPAGTSATLEPDGEVLGPVTVTFVGTDSYVIELLGG